MVSKVFFSSKTAEWETPQWLFDELNEEFGFTLDVCASEENHKCEKYFDIEMDGLKQDWSKDICWCNPPYGRGIEKWISKAALSALRGATVVCLLPARTDTKWFHEHIWNRQEHGPYRVVVENCGVEIVRYEVEVRLLKGRLKFGGATNSAPFPSMIVIFGKHNLKHLRRGAD
jgi:hypothetical protein